MTELGQNLFNGLVLSGIYVLVALGITLVFGLTRLINFAHGQLLVIGTFVAYTVTSHGYSVWLGILASTVVAGVLALALERGVFRFTLDNPLNGLIIGLGIFLVAEVLIVRVWGTNPVTVPSPFDGAWVVQGVRLSFNRVTAIAIAAVATAVFLLFLKGSRIGRRIEAAQENPLAAAHVGVNVGQVISVAFVIGSAAAGTAGAILGTLFPFDAFQGGGIILKGFAVALLGGLGNVPGAVVASLLYGFGETAVGGYWEPAWVPAFTFGIIIVTLLVRPGGLMGTPVSDSPSGQFGERRQFEAPLRLTIPAPARNGMVIACIAVPVVAFNLLPSTRLQAVFVLAAIYLILTYSLSLLYHNAGMLSVAQGGFMAIGAYTSAFLSVRYGWGFWTSLMPAFVLSAVAGLALGVPVARARGHYFILLTFAFGSLVIVLIQNLKSLTQGDQGLLVSNPPGSIGPASFDSLSSMFYLFFGFVLAVALAMYLIQRSPLGVRLASIRDNERLARSLGLNVQMYKVLAFGISGGIAGVGGVLFLYQQRVIVPDSFTVLASIQFLIAALVGGRGLLGPAVGVLIILLVPEMLGLDPLDKELVYGLVLVGIMFLLPRGVVPSIGVAVTRLGRRFSERPPFVSETAAVATISEPMTLTPPPVVRPPGMRKQKGPHS